ncbi:MAG: hypothetical protein ACK5BG_08175 [Pseudanabaena sp.]|jgi:adenylate cyclase
MAERSSAIFWVLCPKQSLHCYTISSKLSTCLDVKEIGTLVIEEASRLIPCTSASVMLHSYQTNCLEIVSAKGTAEDINSFQVSANVGIAGHV